MEKNMDTKFDFNETGRFDFKQVGKRMPYTTPDGFFKDMEKNILETVKDDTVWQEPHLQDGRCGWM